MKEALKIISAIFFRIGWKTSVSCLTEESINKLSLANVFVMLYYFIQDDIMDSAKGEHKEQAAARQFISHAVSVHL